MDISLDKWVLADRRSYERKKQRIQDAMSGQTGIIPEVAEEHKEDIFYMLLFCLCVPQSKAIKAEEAIDLLRRQDFFRSNINRAEVLRILTGRVRFQEVKTDRLIEAKRLFAQTSFWERLVEVYSEYRLQIDSRTVILKSARKWLMSVIDGMGMKLASHFLRNIGMKGLAILDVHVLSCMSRRGLIDEASIKPLTISRYETISEVMFQYAQSVGIALDELDLLFWSERTGYVFK